MNPFYCSFRGWVYGGFCSVTDRDGSLLGSFLTCCMRDYKETVTASDLDSFQKIRRRPSRLEKMKIQKRYLFPPVYLAFIILSMLGGAKVDFILFLLLVVTLPTNLVYIVLSYLINLPKDGTYFVLYGGILQFLSLDISGTLSPKKSETESIGTNLSK